MHHIRLLDSTATVIANRDDATDYVAAVIELQALAATDHVTPYFIQVDVQTAQSLAASTQESGDYTWLAGVPLTIVGDLT